MSDRELLEAAARAAGLRVRLVLMNGDLDVGANRDRWNPLTNDGDALRLAVKCGICFGPNIDGDFAVAFGIDGNDCVEDHGLEPYAATRRAIVRAAARMAKEQA